MPAPHTKLANGGSPTNSVTQITFADPRDGWLAVPDLWATHDSGRTWRRLRGVGNVQQLAVTHDAVWVIAYACRRLEACRWHLVRSPLGSDHFTRVSLPIRGWSGSLPALSASGDTVAVLAKQSKARRNDAMVVESSFDDGKSWELDDVPCFADLSGQISVSGQAAWVACRTGSLATLHRLDEGRIVHLVFHRDLPASLYLDAISDTSAFIGSVSNRADRLTNGGAAVTQAKLPRRSRVWTVQQTTFANPSVGYAVYLDPTKSLVIRTRTGGRTWLSPPGEN